MVRTINILAGRHASSDSYNINFVAGFTTEKADIFSQGSTNFCSSLRRAIEGHFIAKEKS